LKFGVGLPTEITSLSSAVDYACVAEELGFDSVVTADHVSMKYEALTVLTAVAVKTSRIRIGTLVLDGNRRDPAVLAQATATLDRISKGRLILGVGKGVFNEASYGFNLEKPVARMLDILKALKELWRGGEVSYSCEFFSYDKLRIRSNPLQKPHPPIWLAAFRRRMRRIAAEFGDGFVTQNMPPKLFKDYLEEAGENALRVGRDPGKLEAVYGMMPVAVASDRRTARKMVEPSARAFLLRHARRLSEELGYGKPWSTISEVPEEVIDECFVFGTSEECADKVEEYVKAGATYIIFQSVLPQGVGSLKSLAGEIFRR
jgi:alkanesulfonate monooxygenase SsuD/methylene tetrahydromethanopterin reductase-like flavin-dependent oxidoreductase (luciferase family)